MSICLCNLSADAALELVAQKKLEVTPASPDFSSFVADPELAKDALGNLAEMLPRPIELMVGNARQRRNAADIVSHVWQGPLPKNGILALDEEVYVSSPEFTLLQQSRVVHQASLCQMLGRYLGTWTPMPNEPYGQGERAPLTTLESLNEFLTGMGRIQGIGNLRLAMAHTCEGAASAPETTLQLALCLPPELHGLNLTQPTMNYKVDLSTKAQRLCSHQSIRIDLCWPQALFGLEYQGDKHGNQLGQDYARWFAAREERYELWFVAKEQLESATQMMQIGHEVAKRIGCNVNMGLWPTEGELQDLLDTLAGRKHPKPVSYDERRKRRTRKQRWRRAYARSRTHVPHATHSILV